MLGSLNRGLFTYLDLVSIWQLVEDRFVGVFAKLFETAFEVSSHVAHFFFGISGVEACCLLAAVGKIQSVILHEFNQIVSQMFASKAHFLYGM